MTRRALLVGINDYRNIQDLNGCLNDVANMRDILKNYFGFRNEDIRVLVNARATKDNILHRLNWMAENSKRGDYFVFHFSGHGSRIRDRNGDELNDYMDEILCTYSMSNNWGEGYITDDELETVFSKIPDDASLEVFLDCCHSGWDTGPSIEMRGVQPAEQPVREISGTNYGVRYLNPPIDIVYRYEGEEDYLESTHGFTWEKRSTRRHVIWAACQPNQESADAYFGGAYNGAFTYFFCKHMRESNGNISRRELLERIRASLSNAGFVQTPEMKCISESVAGKRPLQFPELEENRRLLFLTTPNMRGQDVVELQEALSKAGYDIEADGVFGPYTRVVVIKYQERNGLIPDGVVGPSVRKSLFGT